MTSAVEAGPSSPPAARPSKERHVAFAAKCQVIPPQEDFADLDGPDTDYFGRPAKKKSKNKTLHFFRSKRSHSWSSASAELVAQTESKRAGSQDSSPGHRASSSSQTFPPLSPTLPIQRTLPERRKLISPPPPQQETPLSPTHSHSPVMLQTTSPSPLPTPQSPPSSTLLSSPPQEGSPRHAILTHSQNSSEDLGPPTQQPLAKPKAVRKPLAFGNHPESGDVNGPHSGPAGRPTLRFPRIVFPPAQSSLDGNSAVDARTILAWDGHDDDTASSSAEDAEDDEEVATPSPSPLVLPEEDLNCECVCAGCEQKMLEALSPSYVPPWTRNARRKYLADRQESQRQGAKKAVRPPIWLRSEEAENDAVAMRSIKADEVDSKKGVANDAVVPKTTEMGNDRVHGAQELHDGDNALRRDVEQELRLREEEEPLRKNQKAEMNRLSGDTGTGLRIGGGGARAMMRQLEMAEQAERRARIERSRSPHIESPVEAPRPMGAAPNVPSKPFEPPPRLNSPDVEKPNEIDRFGIEAPSRTPSPLKRILNAVRDEVGATNKEKAHLPSRDRHHAHTPDNEKKGKHERRPESKHSDPPRDKQASPSLLIKRELALGIPVHSTGSNSPRSRASWHSSHSSLAVQQQHQPPPQTPHRHDVPPKTEADSGQAESAADSQPGRSGGGSSSGPGTSGSAHTKSAAQIVRAQSLSAPRRSSPLAQVSSGSTVGPAAPVEEASAQPTRRAFSSGSSPRERPTLEAEARRRNADKSRTSDDAAEARESYHRRTRSLGAHAGHAVALSPAANSGHESIVEQARSKARSSLRGFVARIRN